VRLHAAALFLVFAREHAHADPPAFHAHPTFAVRGGLHHTEPYVAGFDDEYGIGSSNGTGQATEIEAGLRFHPQWSATGFVDYAPHSANLEIEYPDALSSNPYKSRFHNLYVGARVTWRPIRLLSIGGALARAEVWQRNRPLDSGGEAFDSRRRGFVLQLTLGTELARFDRYSLQLSIGLAGDPLFSAGRESRVILYVPVFVGLGWD
jgi:hypothetical protein